MNEQTLARRINLLRQIQPFSEIEQSDLRSMIDDFRLREFQKDDIIFRQGDDSSEIYAVLKGKVRIYKISPGGDETTIDIFSTHDVIGEIAALDDLPRSATAKAINQVSMLVMAQQRFLHYVRTIPSLGLGLARLLSAKLRWTASYAESVSQFDAAGRLLHFILLSTDRYGTEVDPGQKYVLDLGLNQSDLASIVGARREWVNRLLGDWRRRGLVDFNRGVITILDMERVRDERDSRIEANLDAATW